MSEIDKRKNRRIPIIAEVVFKSGFGKPVIKAFTVTISHGGIGLYAKEPLLGEVQGRVELDIVFIDERDTKVVETAGGRVIWNEPVAEWYAVGIEFEGLNPKDHGRLLSLLDWGVK